ncbi:hypothetical protein ACOJCD_001882 [Cronobacter dublinensis]|uniref:hypothetical protein n=1 Tax=Cronobacter dublinensis TaxID=413497 RepID=UPI001F38105E|nr:hypothetical protein [Cronobacter dublinensis]
MKLPTLFIELSIFCPALSAVDLVLSTAEFSANAEEDAMTEPNTTASRVFEILVLFIDSFLWFAQNLSRKPPRQRLFLTAGIRAADELFAPHRQGIIRGLVRQSAVTLRKLSY